MLIQRSTSHGGPVPLEIPGGQLRAEQRELLRLVAEQKAIPCDQLARFLDLSPLKTEAIVDLMCRERLVGVEQMLTGESSWVWLRPRGARCSATGFRAHKPGRAGLSHLRQINEVRLQVESSQAELDWVSERYLRRAEGGRPQDFLPDAVVRAGRELHAIEVELGRKPEAQLDVRLSVTEARYDAVVYFVTPEVGRYFWRLGLRGRHPKLVVREIVMPSPMLTRADWRVPGDPPPAGGAERLCFDPSEFDVRVLDLLAEQQAIPMDQLREFLGESEDAVEGLVWCYLRAGLVRRACPVPSEAAWVWLTLRGMKASRHALSEPRPRVGGLAMLRAVNEVRLSVSARPGLRWVSGRVMRRESGRFGSVPKAVIETGGERHAVDVWLSNPKDVSTMNELIRSREREYDVVVWFYSRRACARVEQFAALDRSSKLVVRPLPTTETGDLRPQTWRVDVGDLRPELWGPEGARRLAPRTAADELWARLRKAEPAPMLRVAEDQVPREAFLAIAEVSGAEQVGLTGLAWRRVGGTSMVFRLETDAGAYRVVRSKWGWRAARVVDEGVFELLEGPMLRPRARPRLNKVSHGTYEEVPPPSPEFGDEVWEAVRPLIPPVEERPKAHAGRKPLSDRVMLNGMVYLLRTGTSLRRLGRELGYGTGATIKARAAYWEDLGVFDAVREALAQALPDGHELDWSRLDARASRSPTRTGS